MPPRGYCWCPVAEPEFGGPFRQAPWWDSFTLRAIEWADPLDAQTALSALSAAVEGAMMASGGSSAVYRAALIQEVLTRMGQDSQAYHSSTVVFDAQYPSDSTVDRTQGWTLPHHAVIWLPQLGYTFDPIQGTELIRPVNPRPDAPRLSVKPHWSQLPCGPQLKPPPVFGALLESQLVLHELGSLIDATKPARQAHQDRAGIRMLCWLTARALEEDIPRGPEGPLDMD